ncbi:hypothetical protein [Sphingomonas faeni]|uniref:hypothetical protein n=1 Tax=Sphingomonas faeni TaxID=185950 RepID=UPI002412E9E1|nr:hypothetical protein [Sphingomonas faeni]
MAESLVSQVHERLLAALFLRSNITNRRRRYEAGYLMSELDGVTLSQSEIFVAYRELVERGFLKSGVVSGDLVLKLTEDGDLYCRQIIFPELLSGATPADGKASVTPKSSKNIDFAELSGLSMAEMAERLQADHQLALAISSTPVPDVALPEASREALRSATMAVCNQLPELNLSNFAGAQADASIKIIMILADAPAASKADLGRYLGVVADLLAVGSAVWGSVIVIKAYLLAN